MKNYILFFLLILFIFPFSNEIKAQIVNSTIVPVDEVTGLITYREVVEVEGTKKELFYRCISSWLNEAYTNSPGVTSVRDAATGKIIGNHRFRIHQTGKKGNKINTGMILYSFTIEVKDGRYRYTLSDLLLKRPSRYPIENWFDKSDPAYNTQWNAYLKQIDEFVKSWIEDLKEKMQPKAEVVEEEW
ncbi:MAG: DUF4468 domain-containing protein [Bacteroidales bacterium]|nr:DUF4468 domain-containing protein [Bacteroidales bacterium]